MSLYRRLALTLCGYAARTAPPHRAAWARGMDAELAHIDDREVLFFAAGCLWSAWVWRLSTPEGMVAVGRAALTVVSLIFAASCFVAASRPGLAAPFVVLGLFYAAIAWWAARGSFTIVILVAVLGLLRTAAGFAMTVAWPYFAEPLQYVRFYRAAMVEEACLLLMMLAGALVLRRIAAKGSAVQ